MIHVFFSIDEEKYGEVEWFKVSYFQISRKCIHNSETYSNFLALELLFTAPGHIPLQYNYKFSVSN